MRTVMGTAKDFWREMVPILGRTHPAFREPRRPANRGTDNGGDDDLRSEVRGLRREVRELSEELVRQRKVLAGIAAEAGRDGPTAPQSQP